MPVIFALALGLASCVGGSCDREEAPEPPPQTLDRYGILEGAYQLDTVRMPSRVALSTFLEANGVPSKMLPRLGDALDGGLSARKFRAGRPTIFYRDPDSLVRYVVYQHSPREYVRMEFSPDTLRVLHDSLPVVREQVYAHARIESSLWNAMQTAGAKPELALHLSDIFAWTVDFFGLAAGDEFVAIYDRELVGDEEIAVGTVHTAQYIHAGDTVTAYRFMQDSVHSYWDSAGNSLRRAFLKAPLQFSRISSHFSYARRHPILKIVRPHTGVDYAAPRGTPVMALGDGTIIARTFQRGGGNVVKIRHNSVYTTAYLHLQGFAKGVRVGARVAQGQVIGYVGSTGLSTGPHLDFRVWKHGRPVNPLTVESPSVEPVSEANRPDFLLSMQGQDSALAARRRLEGVNITN